MARKKYEFRPDKLGSGLLSKFHITKRQQTSILKWLLYICVLLVLSVVQDAILSRLRVYDATFDLLPCAIILICILEGSENGCIFTLFAASCYAFSGSAPGIYCIVFITFLALFASMFRKGFLRKGFGAAMLCLSISILVYEALVFGVVLFFGRVTINRWSSFFVSGLLALCVTPVLYPIVRSIEKIGGETWRD